MAWPLSAAPGGALRVPLHDSPLAGGVIPSGEQIVFGVRPSLWFVVLWRAEWLGGIVLAGVAGSVGIERGWVPLAPVTWWAGVVAVVAGLLLWGIVEWGTRLYVLTDQRAMRQSGVLRQTTVDVPLAHVQNLVLYKRLRERVLGLGTPLLSSAAPGIGGLSWDYAARPEVLMQAVRDAQERAGPPGHAPARGGGL